MPPGDLTLHGIECAMKRDVNKHWCTLQWCASRGWFIAHEKWKSWWTSEFPAQMASNAENVSIWLRHHGGSQKPLCDLLIKLPCIWITVGYSKLALIYETYHDANNASMSVPKFNIDLQPRIPSDQDAKESKYWLHSIRRCQLQRSVFRTRWKKTVTLL